MARDEQPVIDFDFSSPDYAERWMDIYHELHATCPVARSPRHGGFWVVSDHATVRAVAADAATYSSDHDPHGERTGYVGVGVPASSGTRSIPQEVDPPEFFRYRRLLNPWFSATAVDQWRPWLRTVATSLLDERIETGRLDLVEDFAFPLPACFVVSLLGLPVADWRELIFPFHALIAATPGSPQHQVAGQRLEEVLDVVRQVVAARRRRPRADLISRLVPALTDDEVLSVCQLMLFGGADSTTALFGRVAHWLGAHPDRRRALIEEPALLATATEEFLRYFSPIHVNGRTVTRDTELGGCPLRAGDRVLISWAGANHDSSVVDRPDRLDPRRDRVRHLAFGFGIHRCLGAHFARLMFTIMLTELLARVPEYALDPSGAREYPSVGQVNGFTALPATFPPGTRAGVDLATALARPNGMAVSR